MVSLTRITKTTTSVSAAKTTAGIKIRAKRDREEETPIEFGELLDWELLENREDILALSKDLMSGGGEPLDYVRIYNMLLPELREEVAALGIDTPNAPNRDQLIDAIAKYAAEKKAAILTTGILEILDDEEGGPHRLRARQLSRESTQRLCAAGFH
jgi:hypothetical protein